MSRTPNKNPLDLPRLTPHKVSTKTKKNVPAAKKAASRNGAKGQKSTPVQEESPGSTGPISTQVVAVAPSTPVASTTSMTPSEQAAHQYLNDHYAKLGENEGLKDEDLTNFIDQSLSEWDIKSENVQNVIEVAKRGFTSTFDRWSRPRDRSSRSTPTATPSTPVVSTTPTTTPEQATHQWLNDHYAKLGENEGLKDEDLTNFIDQSLSEWDTESKDVQSVIEGAKRGFTSTFDRWSRQRDRNSRKNWQVSTIESTLAENNVPDTDAQTILDAVRSGDLDPYNVWASASNAAQLANQVSAIESTLAENNVPDTDAQTILDAVRSGDLDPYNVWASASNAAQLANQVSAIESTLAENNVPDTDAQTILDAVRSGDLDPYNVWASA